MTGGNLTAGDVLALTKGNDGMFGGVGGFILLFIFLLAINGGGFFGGTSNGLALADIQNSLYNQSQDNNARALAQGQCNITDSILNASYNNLLASKDTQYQISNSTASLSNQISNQTLALQNMFNQQTIEHLREVNSNLKDELSNSNQTALLTKAISDQTTTILNSIGRYVTNPPCYQNCGCNGLY